MLVLLQIVTAVLVAMAMALSLAHALELPGKMRLTREQYLAVQRIYYPGFTVGGASEPLAMIALIALMAATPSATSQFLLYAGALASLAVAHLIFWIITQPVNRFWLRNQNLAAPAKRFFGSEATGGGETDWTRLRDRWERSHVLRAMASMLGFILVLVAVAD